MLDAPLLVLVDLETAEAASAPTGPSLELLAAARGLTGGDIKRRDVRSGAAGHSSFVLMSTPSGDDTGLRATATVVLISDSEPDATTKVSDIAVDPFTDRLAIIDGWTVQYTGSSDATAQAVRRSQRDGADDAVTQLLLNFKRQRRTLHLEGVIHLGHVRARKLYVHDSTDALNNFSLNLGHICSNTEFLYIDAVRGFPEIKRLLRLLRFPSARS